MELSPSLEAASCAATEEFSNIMWNPKVHYRVHKSHLLVPILSQVKPFYYYPPTYFGVFLVISFDFPTNILYAILSHSCYMPCPFYPSLLIIRIILGEEYKLWSSSLCSFLQPPLTSSLSRTVQTVFSINTQQAQVLCETSNLVRLWKSPLLFILLNTLLEAVWEHLLFGVWPHVIVVLWLDRCYATWT
jgi:hypothetical protein